ncbi:MAG: type IV pilus assembly protein PilM [Omnitrophica bacterium]|nr:type IV pilus assembly protein PilM [Candidatus Omnitrophota bacterium]
MKINVEELLSQFKKPKDTALGLDIGKDSIKLVELRQEGGAIKLTKVDLIKIPQLQSVVALEQHQLIKKLIGELLAKNQIKRKDVVLSVKGQSTFVKFLEVLPVSKEKLAQTIKYEAQQQIPFSLDEVEWDAHVFKTGDEQTASVYQVLLVAIKKDKLAGRVSLIEQTGLHLSVLDISTLSIYNCIRFNQDYDENKLTCLLDIGAQSSDLLILKGAKFWMRSFAIGGDNITSGLEKKFNISFSDAEKLKQKMNIESADIKEAIAPALEDLQGEISRSVEYYFFQQKQTSPVPNGTTGAKTQIEQILLSGGTSLMQGLDKLLAEKFSCQVRSVEPFKMFSAEEELKDKFSAQNKALFSQAMGLALRGLNRSWININLFKEQIKLKSLARQRVVYGVGSLVLALVILLGASTFMRQDYRERSLRLRKLKGLLETFSTHQPRIKELKREEAQLYRKVEALSNLALNRSLWLVVLSELQKMLPDNLWIIDFRGTFFFDAALDQKFASKLDVQGKAVSYQDVNNFVSRLKASTLFSEVKPLSSAFIEEQVKDQDKDKQKVEVVKFSISMKVLPEVN